MWILRTDANAQADPFTFRILPGGVKILGRAVPADFIVDTAMVSRQHCRLTHTNGQLRVEDLNSTNGTFVNDRRIGRSVLVSGDRLRVGHMDLVVSYEPSLR